MKNFCIKILLLNLLFLAAVFVNCSETDRLVNSDGTIDLNRYYSTQETYKIMRLLGEKYPDLTNIFSIGKSYLGAELLVMEVTNGNSGRAEDKPALYVDGNIHSGELTGSAVTLHLMVDLLTKYGNDPRITRLLDTRVFYLRPKFNPDGADLALLHDVNLRSSVRPIDNDGDGVADDDPAEDLNGDGYIVSIRYKDPNGRWKINPADRRSMLRVSAEDARDSGTAYYNIISEGIDNDGDGNYNEDDIGGLDLNRNFPRNWELQYLQPGAGPFALSEPETYSTVKFIDSKPNITGIVHNHTSGGFVYRLPSTGNPDTFPPDDIALIISQGDEYTNLTGRPIERSYTSPERHRYGTLISWGYWDKGIIGWVPEYWPGIDNDLNGDGETDEVERLKFDDEKLGGKYFREWEIYKHPQLGTVEIGGWRTKFVRQNSPSEMLGEETAMQLPWIMYLAEESPLLQADEPVVESLGEGKFKVSLNVINTGAQPTNLTDRAVAAELIKPVFAEIHVSGGVAVGKAKVSLGHIVGTRMEEGGGKSTAEWVIEATMVKASFSIKITSEKGGSFVVEGGELRPN